MNTLYLFASALFLMSFTVVAAQTQASLKPHALYVHAHSLPHTSISPCKQDTNLNHFTPESIISDKVPCPGNSMGIQTEPHIDPNELMSKVVYPSSVKTHRKEAWVSLVVLIDDKGKYNRHILECIKAFNPANTKWDARLAIEEIQALESSAVAALQSVTFEPAQRDGKPLQCWIAIPIHYRP
jgi:hypothetical protein